MTVQQADLWSQRIHAYAERKPMGRQLKAVRDILSDGDWWTFDRLKVSMLNSGIGISEAGVSARLRDLRKPCYGGHVIDRRATGRKGIFEYKMSA